MRCGGVAFWALVAGIIAASEARVCESTGKDAPTVATLTTSKDGTEGVVVQPDCEFASYAVEEDDHQEVALSLLGLSFQRVESYPANVDNLILDQNDKLTGGDLKGANKAYAISISICKLTSLNGFSFPKSLRMLSVYGNWFEQITVPDGVTSLSLGFNKLKSFAGSTFPSSVTTLHVTKNAFTDAKFQIPNSVQYLDMSQNAIKSLEGIGWSSSMTTFRCSECPITTIRGVKFTRAFSLELLGVSIYNFEIRASDVAIVKTMKLGFKAGEETCVDATAKQVTITNSITACVITDDRFEKKYVTGTIPKDGPGSPTPGKTSSSGKSTAGSGSGKGASKGSKGSSAGSGGSDDGTSSGTATGGTGSTGVASGSASTANSQGFYPNGTAADGSPASAKNNKPSGGDKSSDTEASNTKTASSSSTLVTVVGIIGGVIVIAIAVIGYRYRLGVTKKKEKKRDPSHDFVLSAKDDTTTTPSFKALQTVVTGGSNSSQEYFSNDIRNDEALIPFRIERGDIHVDKVIARGGFGVIYIAKFHDRAVAVKQLLPEHSRNNNVIKQFMDEIRLCARLDHPKIVEFVGITFSSLRDLAVVIEFMARGDLHSILYDSAHRSQASDWFQPSAQLLKPKTELAIDVSQALTYLHSFDQPIIHRDLKARNVLIGMEGNAKLSDFGISREVSIDETMTGEVGTLAWIAPEILRGERYSEKADSYSFGVLLSELDRGGHPYGIGDRVTHGVGPTNELNNTQIALQVSSGKLRPVPTNACPLEIRKIMERCLNFRADDRPTSMELFYQLRQLQQTHAL